MSRPTITSGDDGREHRTVVAAIAECPECGEPVELVAETEAWTRSGDADPWRHAEYGPGQGICCGLLIVDSYDGCRVYRLRGKPEDATR